MLRRLIGGVFLAMSLYAAAGTAGGLIRTGEVVQPDVRIYLLAGPIHTDILLPLTPDAREAFGFLDAVGMPLEGADWLTIGWGSRAFYTQTGTYADVKLSNVWTAATGDDAVMRVNRVPTGADVSGLKPVGLGADQFTALLAGVRNSFASETPLDLAGLNGSDRFFAATGRFHLLRTCNVWVGDVLRAAGARVGVWTPFTWSLP